MRTSQRPGSSATNRGAIVAKYGALKQTARPNSQWPPGQRVIRRYRDSNDALIESPEDGSACGRLVDDIR
jgi:hypothetical protein